MNKITLIKIGFHDTKETFTRYQRGSSGYYPSTKELKNDKDTRRHARKRERGRENQLQAREKKKKRKRHPFERKKGLVNLFKLEGPVEECRDQPSSNINAAIEIDRLVVSLTTPSRRSRIKHPGFLTFIRTPRGENGA